MITPTATSIKVPAIASCVISVPVLSLASPPATGNTPGVALRLTVAVGMGVSLGGFPDGGCGVLVGTTGVFVGGGGVGVKPASAGAACHVINDRIITLETMTMPTIFRFCIAIFLLPHDDSLVVQRFSVYHTVLAGQRFFYTTSLQFCGRIIKVMLQWYPITTFPPEAIADRKLAMIVF
jgi:hypothetical protein